MRQLIQVTFRPAAKRRPQDSGQRQIVLRRIQKGKEGRQILDRHFAAKVQPVSPGDGQVQRLAGSDDLVKQRGPALHQDQKIAIVHWPRRRPAITRRLRDLLAPFNQRLDLRSNLAGQHHLGILGVGLVQRVIPGAGFQLDRRFDHRPDINPPGQRFVESDVARLAADSGLFHRREGGIHHGQDRRRGPERMGQRLQLQRLTASKAVAEEVTLGVKGDNIRALEGIDRLLLVADHKQRPEPVAGPQTGSQLIREVFDQLPLIGAGVLRLIHQNMVDAPVQPEQHPGRQRPVGQQGPRPSDEVVKVQKAPRRLAFGVIGQKDRCKLVQGQSLFGTGKRQSPQPPGLNPGHQVIQRIEQRPQFGAGVLGRKIADLGGKTLVRVRLGDPEKQHVLQHLQTSQIRRHDICRAKSGSGLHVI